MSEDRKTYPALLADRTVEVYEATETQLAFIGRFAKKVNLAANAGQTEEAVYAMASILDILDSLVVKDEDREFLGQLMMTGKLEASDFIEAWRDAIPVKKATTPPPRVSRGKAR